MKDAGLSIVQTANEAGCGGCRRFTSTYNIPEIHRLVALGLAVCVPATPRMVKVAARAPGPSGRTKARRPARFD